MIFAGKQLQDSPPLAGAGSTTAALRCDDVIGPKSMHSILCAVTSHERDAGVEALRSRERDAGGKALRPEAVWSWTQVQPWICWTAREAWVRWPKCSFRRSVVQMRCCPDVSD